jgi:uncharacterized protein (DUF1800 family)
MKTIDLHPSEDIQLLDATAPDISKDLSNGTPPAEVAVLHAGQISSMVPASLSVLSLATLAACGGGGGEATPLVGSNSPIAAAPGSAPSPTAGAPPAPTTGAAPAPTATPGTPAPAPSGTAAPAPGATPAPAPGATPAPAPGQAPAPSPAPAPAPGAPASATNDLEAARFLQQAQFSSIDTEIASVRSGTYANWLQGQYNLPLGQTGFDWLGQRGYNVNNKNQYFFNLALADFMVWNQLFTGTDQVRRRMALALSEFFVASLESAEFDWRSQAYAAWWDMLMRNAFGNFRQLLEDVTLNAAMGFYLNTRGNEKENPATGRVPDENYAREVMQLFTIGLVQLNQDGTEKTANGQKLDAYTQQDVTNLARVFTGYDFDRSVGTFRPVRANGMGTEDYSLLNLDFVRRPMVLNANRHSTLAVSFLGTNIPANTPGAQALKTALDTLFNHPNTGPFFCKQMIQRLVTSSPSPGYVSRVAAAFSNNGQGVRGDLKAVWSAILLDVEARSPQAQTTAGFGKLREPIVRFVQWGRTFGFNSASGGWKMFETKSASEKLGQSPLRSPSVFNFFRPGFVPPGTALATSKTAAPEFQLVNESTVGGYLNYMQQVLESGIFVASPPGDPNPFEGPYVQDITASYVRELAIVTDAAALVARINLVMCAGRLSPATVTIMVNALNATPVTASSDSYFKLSRVRAAILMAMGCAEYLIQK